MPAHSKKTAEVTDAIIRRISEGEPLAVICRDPGMPTPACWGNWLKEDESLVIAYARAREIGFDAIAAECLSIAEDGSKDYATKKREDGSAYEAFDSEHVQRSKLRIETRLKLLAKWDPKRYGEKVTQELTGAGGAPLFPAQKMTDDQLAAIANGSSVP